MTTTKKTKGTNVHVTVKAPEAVTATTEQSPPVEQTTPAIAAPLVPAPPPVVGSGLAAKVLAIIAAIEEIPVLLGTSGSPATALSIDQRRGLPKMKTGAEEQIPGVLALADRYKISIAGGGTAEARADMQLVTILQPLETWLGSATTLVGDVIAQAKARTWETTTTAYATLKLRRYQKAFPALQQELDPMASFLATKHKSAPTALRQAEAKTLSRTRSTLKAKKEKAATAPAVAPVVHAPPAGQTGAGTVTGAPATSGNGATHS